MPHSFIEENHAFKEKSRREQAAQPRRGPHSQEVMQFWGEEAMTISAMTND